MTANGPENTRVDAAELNVPYTIGVHNYARAAGRVATVEVFCGGVTTPTQVFTSRPLQGTASGNSTGNDFWRVAQVVFTQCGLPGGPCCPGDACGAGASCVSGLCEPCGANTQRCCEFSSCAGPGLRCDNANTCQVCGGVGQRCCGGGICDAGARCGGVACVACGGPGQPCCTQGPACSGALTCAPCGGPGQACGGRSAAPIRPGSPSPASRPTAARAACARRVVTTGSRAAMGTRAGPGRCATRGR